MSADCVTLERQDNGLYTVIIDDIMHTDMPYKKAWNMLQSFFPNIHLPADIETFHFNLSSGDLTINGKDFNPQESIPEASSSLASDAFVIAVQLAIERLVREGRIKGIEVIN